MAACSIAPADMRKQVRMVGNDLLKNFGKRYQYSVHQVREANKRQGVGVDVACWSHAFFNSHSEFDRYHQTLGETCDYGAMKRELLESVSIHHEASWFDVDLSWLELPDIDLSIFDFLDF